MKYFKILYWIIFVAAVVAVFIAGYMWGYEAGDQANDGVYKRHWIKVPVQAVVSKEVDGKLMSKWVDLGAVWVDDNPDSDLIHYAYKDQNGRFFHDNWDEMIYNCHKLLEQEKLKYLEED